MWFNAVVRRCNRMHVAMIQTCVKSAPRPCRPEWRSWWRSTGSAESAGPSLSWAHPNDTHAQKQTASLTSWVHNFIWAEIESLSPSAYGKIKDFCQFELKCPVSCQNIGHWRPGLIAPIWLSHLDPKTISLINPGTKPKTKQQQQKKGSGACCYWLTHQEHQGWAANHGDGGGEFAFVPSTVRSCTAACIICQTELLDAPLCHLQKEEVLCLVATSEHWGLTLQ